MTTSPTEVFLEAIELLRSGRVSGWADLCTDDVVFEFPFAPPGRPARVEGRDALRAYLNALSGLVRYDAITDLQLHQTTNPAVVVVEFGVTGTITGSEREYAMSYICVVTVRDGLIAHYRDYWNPLALAAALGSAA